MGRSGVRNSGAGGDKEPEAAGKGHRSDEQRELERRARELELKVDELHGGASGQNRDGEDEKIDGQAHPLVGLPPVLRHWKGWGAARMSHSATTSSAMGRRGMRLQATDESMRGQNMPAR